MWELFNTKSDLTFALFLLPAAVTFFSATTLLFLEKKSRSRRNMCILMCVLTLCMAACVVDYQLTDPPYGIYRFWDIISSIVAAPFMFLYLASIVRPQKWCVRAVIPWFAFAGLLLLAEIMLMATGNAYSNVFSWGDFREELWRPEPLLRFIALCYFVFEIIFFAIWLFRITYVYRKGLSDSYSYTEKISLKWMYYISILLIIFGFASAFYITNSELFYKTVFVAVSFVFMLTIHILGSWQEEVPYTDSSVETADLVTESIAALRMQKLMAEIDAYFEKTKPFLNPRLTLNDVADMLHSNRTYVSKAINNERGISFYQYVNIYRIQYALELMSGNERTKYSMDAISAKSGFNSLSTFYAFFKQEKGCTPKKYLQNQNLNFKA